MNKLKAIGIENTDIKIHLENTLDSPLDEAKLKDAGLIDEEDIGTNRKRMKIMKT